MASFDPGVDAPRGLSYAAPLINFQALGDLGNDYWQGRQQQFAEQQRQRELMLQQPVNTTDPSAAVAEYLRRFGAAGVPQVYPWMLEQQQMAEARGGPPMGAPGAGPGPGAAAAQPQPATALPPGAPPASAAAARPTTTTSTLSDVVNTEIPDQRNDTVIASIAKTMGVEPNTPLTDAQAKRAKILADRAGNSGVTPSGTTAGQPVPNSPLAEGLQRRAEALASQAPSPAQRVAGDFAALPAGVSALPMGQPPTAQRAPAGAPEPAAAPSGPIVPQYALPPDPRTGRPYRTPEEAVTGIDDQIARLSGNKYAGGRIKALEDVRDRIATMITPAKIGASDTYVDPRTGAVVAQGPAVGAAGNLGPQALEAAAQRYLATGTFPPNTGRGIQGKMEQNAIQNRAAELQQDRGLTDEDVRRGWQEYKAQGVGLSAGARTTATREKNLELILRATDAAIPAALEQSEKVARTGWRPLNQIIQRGEVIASDPDLKAFGMANLQLAEHWARAMNPMGVMRESDRELALGFLSLADSKETYRRAVMQLKTQIEREYKAVQSGKTGGGGSLVPGGDAPSATKGGGGETWTTLDNGVRIREVK